MLGALELSLPWTETLQWRGTVEKAAKMRPQEEDGRVPAEGEWQDCDSRDHHSGGEGGHPPGPQGEEDRKQGREQDRSWRLARDGAETQAEGKGTALPGALGRAPRQAEPGRLYAVWLALAFILGSR